MWLLIPLVYLMAWRLCRRFDQAFNETVAWSVGYLITAAIIWITDVGGIDILSARPDGPGAVVAYLGGFAGMWLSHYRWKRRGGPLQPARDPVTRAIRALRVGFAGTVRPRAARPTTSARPQVAPRVPQRTPPRTTVSTGGASKASTAPATRKTTTTTRTVPLNKAMAAAVRAAGTKPGGKTNRWARAISAFLDADSATSRKQTRNQ
jgi:hypothetical protein